MPINENGFLGQDAEVWAEQCEAAHKEYFQLCYDINSFAQKKLLDFSVGSGHFQKNVSACLFARALEAYQSAIGLVKAGSRLNANVLIRVLFEVLVILKNCCNDSEFVSKYFKTDDLKRLKIKRLAHKYPDNPYPRLREAVTVESISEFNEKIKQEKINKSNIEELSNRVGMACYYDYVYRLFSDAVHTLPIVLTEFVETDKEGYIVGLKYGPSDKDAKINLVILAEFMWVKSHSSHQKC